MTRGLVRWMRVVLPDSNIVTLCIALEMLIEVSFPLSAWLGWNPNPAGFRDARLTWLTICSFGYGISRVLLFHPAFNEQYLDWLESSPWTYQKPLPTGPIRQVPQDLVVLAALMLLTRDTSSLVLLLPTFYLVGYLISIAVSARACGDWAFAYLLGFGLEAVAWAMPSRIVSCVIAMACYPIAFIAIERSLRLFPWVIEWTKLKNYTQQNQDELNRERLGWPFDFMSPRLPKLWIPYPDGVCLSLLLGGLVFVTQFHAVGPGRAALCAFICQFATIAIISRIVVYMRAHRWPISFWGRLRTLRWIIPRYDVIYVAPLLAELILVGTQLGAGYLFTTNGGMGNPANPMLDWLAIGCSSCGVAATFLVLLVMGPVLERWALSGAHRIVFDKTALGGKSSQSQFVEV